ncbi:hypothetical protein ABPG77_005643 [Micractinium sp. CCAP 211/92]
MQLHDAGKPEANPYEEERRQRILRNQAVLQNLGLVEHPLGARAAQQPQQRRAAERQQCEPAAAEAAEPKRRSRRLRGEHVELPSLQRFADEQENTPAHPLCRAVREVVRDGGGGISSRCNHAGEEQLDQHNLMRIRSMSEKALRTRIWRIQRVDKLRSFIQMLEACGMAALAAEARRALRQMCGAPSDSEDEQLGEEEG